jgi:AraC-like DNA-binding protein
MVTADSSALARVLDSVDLTVGIARRAPLAPGELLPLPTGSATLVYVASGAVRGHPPLHTGCRLDVDRASSAIAVDEHPRTASLSAGDAFLASGRTAFALEADGAAELVVFDLEFSESARLLASALPDPVTVTSFDALEPAAAALAGSMGPIDPPGSPARQGDPVICRMMAKTVLLSVIRAWAANGCAPAGWPAASDPFLDRVVEAIHERPGDEWTVESLANVGAMSRSVFAERFRAAIGRSPADYVTEVRVDEAKRMLEAGRSVSETSRALGYASDEGFSRAFRRRTGMTPSSWRASHAAVLA